MTYEAATEPTTERPALDPEEVVTDLLDPTDAEDVALLFLQAKGWLLMPSTRMGDTPLYEAALRHRDDGRLAVLAVKSGENNLVPVEEVVSAVPNAEIFVCSTHDAYSAPPEEHGATAIRREHLVHFMADRPELLPPRISRWLTS
jgi:hypothetical protein